MAAASFSKNILAEDDLHGGFECSATAFGGRCVSTFYVAAADPTRSWPRADRHVPVGTIARQRVGAAALGEAVRRLATQKKVSASWIVRDAVEKYIHSGGGSQQ